MNESDIATFELGEEAKKFLQSDIGKYFDGCSLQDLELAKDKLLELNPYEYHTLIELQNKIASLQLDAKVAEKMRLYIAETIEKGRQAEHQLETEE